MGESFERRLSELKIAGKSVLFNFKQYVWFFAVLFIIQSLLLLTLISQQAKLTNIRSTIESEYNYHLVVRSANKTQTAYIRQNQEYVFADDHIYDVVSVYAYDAADAARPKYDVYIRFFGEEYEMHGRMFFRFHEAILESLGDFHYEYSPLHDVADYEREAFWTTALLLGFVFLLSTAALALLFNTRINHYRFDYGVYMTFGADRKRLAKQSFNEMTAISLMTLLPALGFSLFVGAAICRHADIPLRFGLFELLLLLVLTAAVNYFAVFLPVKRVSKAIPNRLLASADNSDLVLSPKISVHLPGQKGSFAKRLALLTRRRFIKYNALVLFSTVLFGALAVNIYFLSTLEQQLLQKPTAQYRLTFSDAYGYDAYLASPLQKLPGVAFVEKREATVASLLTSHVLFDPSDVLPSADLPESGEEKAAHNVYYTACDEEIVSSLSRYRVEGDPSAVLRDDKQVIVSDSWDNVRRLSLKPGDRVRIASFASRRYNATYAMESDELPRFLLDADRYTYETYTVCAVIRDMPSDPNFTMYVSEDTYRQLTATKDEEGNVIPGEIRYEEAYVYAEEGLTPRELTALHESILRLVRDAYDVGNETIAVTVTDLNADLKSRLDAAGGSAFVYAAIALLTLLVTPIVCFFSQTIFYGKRRQEFTLLRSMGAVTSEIRSLHLIDGGVFALSASVLYTILTLTLSALLFRFRNAAAGIEGMRVLFDLPLSVFFIGLALTALSAFLSAYLPYVSFVRGEKKAERSVEFQ